MNTLLRGIIIGVGVSLGLGLGVAMALVVQSNDFKSGEPISSSRIKGYFDTISGELAALDSRIDAVQAMSVTISELEATISALENRLDGASRYLGQSLAMSVSEIGGYRGAAVYCTEFFTTPAHMCTAHDLVIAQSRGQTINVGGWYAAGIRTESVSTRTINDCYGFTKADVGLEGPLWSPGAADAKWQSGFCEQVRPFLCCAD
jgi:hypothetical protein